MKGKVKWFNSRKGYGFIVGEDEKDIFVHYSAVNKEGYKTLSEDEEVTYDLETGDDGKVRAVNVTPA